MRASFVRTALAVLLAGYALLWWLLSPGRYGLAALPIGVIAAALWRRQRLKSREAAHHNPRVVTVQSVIIGAVVTIFALIVSFLTEGFVSMSELLATA